MIPSLQILFFHAAWLGIMFDFLKKEINVLVNKES